MDNLTKKQIWIKARRIIAHELALDPKTITEDNSIQDDLGADSLDAINIVLALEDEFNIKIDDDSMEKFRKFRDIVKELIRVLELQKDAHRKECKFKKN